MKEYSLSHPGNARGYRYLLKAKPECFHNIKPACLKHRFFRVNSRLHLQFKELKQEFFMIAGFYTLIVVHNAVAPLELAAVVQNLLLHLDHLLEKQIIGGKIRCVFGQID